MNISDEAPPLSPWPFIAADLALLAAAFVLGLQAERPFTLPVCLAIAALVFFGALALLIPFVLNSTRRQEAALTERQREIAALAQTTAASAEQLSIATATIQGMADNVAKSIKLMDTLPLKLQEKIHEFKEQLNEVSLNENEILSQEVNTLRAAETERIESVVTIVRKLSGELARLESATRQNVTSLSDVLERFTQSAKAIASEAAGSFSALRIEGENSIGTAHATATAGLEKTLAHALSQIDAKLSALAAVKSARATHPPTHAAAPSKKGAGPGSTNLPGDVAYPENNDETTDDEPVLEPDTIKAPRKKSARKAELENHLSLGLDLPDHAEGIAPANGIAPDSDHTSAVSADGLTRLLVTSYIGIGNKLFIRGEGPGLSWEKGLPLQFVSIGKWRWETADAASPVRLKIYKNDEIECPSLGEISVEPGQQHEVAATF